MGDRSLALYFAWNRLAEISAPLEVVDNRFPALFESRRMLYPQLSELADPSRFEQGISGFIDHVLTQNFAKFISQARVNHGCDVRQVVRGDAAGQLSRLDDRLLEDVDTLVILSFDSMRTGQVASEEEILALRRFLSVPGNMAFVCPHHDIGDGPADDAGLQHRRQVAEHLHHGDLTIPPQQRFGGFARSLLCGLGVPVENRFGLRPGVDADGTPSALQVDELQDRHGLLRGVRNFNAHPHLPHLERLGEASSRMDVLARQAIDPSAPPHPFVQDGRTMFDALLQSRPEVFAGTLLVSDATLWSSTAGGVEELGRFWSNVLERPDTRRDI